MTQAGDVAEYDLVVTYAKFGGEFRVTAAFSEGIAALTRPGGHGATCSKYLA
jgi:hypothetical protein